MHSAPTFSPRQKACDRLPQPNPRAIAFCATASSSPAASSVVRATHAAKASACAPLRSASTTSASLALVVASVRANGGEGQMSAPTESHSLVGTRGSAGHTARGIRRKRGCHVAGERSAKARDARALEALPACPPAPKRAQTVHRYPSCPNRPPFSPQAARFARRGARRRACSARPRARAPRGRWIPARAPQGRATPAGRRRRRSCSLSPHARRHGSRGRLRRLPRRRGRAAGPKIMQKSCWRNHSHKGCSPPRALRAGSEPARPSPQRTEPRGSPSRRARDSPRAPPPPPPRRVRRRGGRRAPAPPEGAPHVRASPCAAPCPRGAPAAGGGVTTNARRPAAAVSARAMRARGGQNAARLAAPGHLAGHLR